VELRLYGSMALLALTAVCPAAAADTPLVTKAPPAIVTASPWSGFYAGVNVGYGVGHNTSNERLGTASTQQFMLAPAGWLVGAQAGYNHWVAPNWVAGIEADWQKTQQRDAVCITVCSGNALGVGTTIALTVEQRLSWLATLRGRLGYLLGHSLWYATGGAAFGRVETNAVFNILGVVTAQNFQHTRSGWTAGAGVETPLAAGWTTKLEYLYVDLGTATDSFPVAGGTTQIITYPSRDHIVRLGLNRQLGWLGPQAAGNFVPAKYGAAAGAYNWNGFYAGLNGGYGVGRNRSTESTAFAGAAISNEHFTLGPAGWLGGGQAGYNLQFTPNTMIGAEADWQWSNQSNSVCVSGCSSNFGFAGILNALTVEQKIHWLTTLRGRVGYVQNDWLLYATGGPAWGHTAENVLLRAGGGVAAGSFNHTKSGFAVGAGSESKVAGNWTAKLEYLYVDLGTVTDTFASTPPAVVQTVTVKVQEHVFRVGFNYAFRQ
jgi:outer membrane immunogenic protein